MFVNLSLEPEQDIIFHKFNIIGFSETYFDFSVSLDDDTLVIHGYNLVHADQLNGYLIPNVEVSVSTKLVTTKTSKY